MNTIFNFSGVYPILEYPKLLIDISCISELKGYYIDQNLVLLGGTTLVEVLHIFEVLSKNEGFHYLSVLCDHLEKVAHVTVRNVSIYCLCSIRKSDELKLFSLIFFCAVSHRSWKFVSKESAS